MKNVFSVVILIYTSVASWFCPGARGREVGVGLGGVRDSRQTDHGCSSG